MNLPPAPLQTPIFTDPKKQLLTPTWQTWFDLIFQKFSELEQRVYDLENP